MRKDEALDRDIEATKEVLELAGRPCGPPVDPCSGKAAGR